MIPLTAGPTSAARLSLASIVVYTTANALEGIVLSLFSKVISAKLATGVFNSGFLATEAGTFGRSCGNALISLFGKYSKTLQKFADINQDHLGMNGTVSLQYQLYGVELMVCVATVIVVIIWVEKKP